MPLLILLERLCKWLLLAGLAGLAAGYWQRDQLPDPGFYDGRIDHDPRQRPTRAHPFEVHAGRQTYRVRPLFDYQLDGMVVSMHHSDSWLDIYHRQDWGDYLNIKDICVIWGDNVRSAVYRDMEFDNTTWTCWAWWPNGEVRRRFRDHQLSNNHLLADRPAVQQAILAARPGDQIRFSGKLAEYANPANGFRRGTSTRRDDRGNGACETVYVEDFQVLRRANPGWRRLFDVSLWLTPLAALGFIGLLAVTPVRRRPR